MDFLNKMERKFGRYAIPNLIIYLIGAYCIGFFLQYLSPTLLGYLNMQPYYVLHGQIWRIIILDLPAAGQQCVLSDHHDVVLFSAWPGIGEYLGNLPV